MNTPKQTPLVDILRLHAEDLHNDYGHNKSARLLSQAADEIERLRSSALALEDEKNDYMDGVGDVLRQDHDGETLWAAAQRVMSERDRLRTDNTGLLTVLDRMLTTLRYLIGIAERGEGHPIGGTENAPEVYKLGVLQNRDGVAGPDAYSQVVFVDAGAGWLACRLPMLRYSV